MEKTELYGFVEKAIAGDSDAFVKLYLKNVKIILFHTRKLVDNPADAEDVAQEIVLQMLQSITKLKSPYAFTTWLYRLITNICYSHNAKNGRTKNESDVGVYADVFAERDGDAIPEVRLDRTELDETIIKAVDKLPDSQRLALFMYYYEQMSYKEIAAAMSITVNTVGSNILKAKKTLKNLIDQEKIISREDIITLGGAAFAPALTHAFETDLGSISAAEVERFRQKCDSRVAEYLRQHTSHPITKTVVSGKFIAIGTVVTVVVVGILVYSFLQTEATPIEIEPYRPYAEIVLQSADGQPGQINPYEATLVVDDGTPTGWNILNAGGEIVTSGEGATIGDELKGLPSGNYRIEWRIQNQNGQSVRAIREIEIHEE
ncbi:hypothetical protein AGMMS49983_01980 [Clostridia bacterium]|nr:hypothetical protein AGMMS49983_01980 [Clostridia bacterium]